MTEHGVLGEGGGPVPMPESNSHRSPAVLLRDSVWMSIDLAWKKLAAVREDCV